MQKTIKPQKQLLLEAQKEKQLADLFNHCMRLMNQQYRKSLTIPTTY